MPMIPKRKLMRKEIKDTYKFRSSNSRRFFFFKKNRIKFDTT